MEVIEEVGGGLNCNRKKFLALIENIGMRQGKTVVVAHRDRLTRFGFEWFERYAKQNGCEGRELNQERFSPEQKMVQDL
jgi:predicted site-specific integrase-resolvase